jgi:hypothetical protein
MRIKINKNVVVATQKSFTETEKYSTLQKEA